MLHDTDRHQFDNAAPIASDDRKVLPFEGVEIPEGEPRRLYNYFVKRMMMRAAQSRLKDGNAFKVFEAVIDFANSETGLAWPSLDTLAEDTGLSCKVVRKGLHAIEDAGVCDIRWSKGGHHGETHLCRPRWHLATEYYQQQQRRAAEKRAARVPKWDDTGAQTGEDGCPNGRGRMPKRASNSYEGTLGIIPSETSREENARHLTAPAGRPADASHCGEEDDQGPAQPFDPNAEARRLAASPLPAKGYVQQPVTDELFRMFTDAFPNKVALEQSKDAFCAAILTDRVPVKDILDGVRRQAVDIQTSERPINATKWLSQQRWIDYGPVPSHLGAERAPRRNWR